MKLIQASRPVSRCGLDLLNEEGEQVFKTAKADALTGVRVVQRSLPACRFFPAGTPEPEQV
ncbi:MAG TPA: hypothetical protein VF932_09685 [Anaerolineae bacterium]